jgi:hypothetical protein
MPAVADRITLEELEAIDGLLVDVTIYAHGKMERDGPPEGYYLVDDDWDIEEASATDADGNDVEVAISKNRAQVLRGDKPILTAASVERINQRAIEVLCECEFDRGGR